MGGQQALTPDCRRRVVCADEIPPLGRSFAGAGLEALVAVVNGGGGL